MKEKRMTQTEKILRWMHDFGSITPLDAMRHFSCMRLASRISEIKALGYDVETRMVHGENIYGDKVTYAEYRLKGA